LGVKLNFLFFNDQIISQDKIMIDPTDRGLLLGDGLFETIRIFSGHPLFFSEHWARLIKSAALIGLEFIKTELDIKNNIYQLIELNNLVKKDASVRITLTRGPGPRGISLPEYTKPSLLISISPLVNTGNQNSEKCTAYVSTKIKRNEYSVLSTIKSLNYLDNILARMDANANNADEALLMNTANYLTGASCANIFLISSSILRTPPVSDGVLPGITRNHVLLAAEKLGLTIQIASIPVDDLFFADEIFITNSLMGIKAVIKINDKFIGDSQIGPKTLLLKNLLNAYYAEKLL
jgi:branched-chain amino acid aminotransferase